jgi:hypothetical protein
VARQKHHGERKGLAVKAVHLMAVKKQRARQGWQREGEKREMR